MKIISREKISAENLKDFDGAELISVKRYLRKPLLKAFDVYKTNVFYGVETETEEERVKIISWYKDLLDLNDSAFFCVPEQIIKYN